MALSTNYNQSHLFDWKILDGEPCFDKFNCVYLSNGPMLRSEILYRAIIINETLSPAKISDRLLNFLRVDFLTICECEAHKS